MPGDGACIVTPGLTPADGHTYTDADFRALGKPTVRVGDAAIGVQHLSPAAQGALSGGGGSENLNFLLNGNFADPLWERGAGPVTCPINTDTLLADNWFANPAGAAITYAQSATVPDDHSLFSALLTGATGATTVRFGQNLPRHVSAQLRQTITVSVYVRNDTGAAFVPSLRFSTPTVANDFSSIVTQLEQTLQSCPTAAWTRVSLSADASTFTNMTNGLRVELVLPSGALSAGSKTVNLSQFKLETGGTATPFAPDYERATTPPGANLLKNGSLSEPLWGAASGSCPVGTDTLLVGDWFCNPAGAAVTLARAAMAPNLNSLHAAQITGAGGADVVDFGQNLARSISAQLRRKVTFSAQVRNDTGGAVIPSLRVSSANSANDFSATTIRVNQPLPSCANGAWTAVTLTFDGNVTDAEKGLRVAVRFPSGALDSGGKSVALAQLKLETGDIPTPFQAERIEPAPPALLAAARNLVLVNGGTPAAQVTATADELIVKTGAGTPLLISGFTATADITVSGANGLDTGIEANSTHYFLWAISNGVAHRALLSVSATAPTMPAGHVFKTLLGSVYNDGGGNFVNFIQYGREQWFRPMNAINTTPAAGSTYEAKVLAMVPPNARSARGNYGSAGAAGRIEIAADANGLGEVAICILDTGQNMAQSAPASTVGSLWTPFTVPIVTPQTIYWRVVNAGITHIVNITGFTL